MGKVQQAVVRRHSCVAFAQACRTLRPAHWPGHKQQPALPASPRGVSSHAVDDAYTDPGHGQMPGPLARPRVVSWEDPAVGASADTVVAASVAPAAAAASVVAPMKAAEADDTAVAAAQLELLVVFGAFGMSQESDTVVAAAQLELLVGFGAFVEGIPQQLSTAVGNWPPWCWAASEPVPATAAA